MGNEQNKAKGVVYTQEDIEDAIESLTNRVFDDYDIKIEETYDVEVKLDLAFTKNLEKHRGEDGLIYIDDYDLFERKIINEVLVDIDITDDDITD